MSPVAYAWDGLAAEVLTADPFDPRGWAPEPEPEFFIAWRDTGVKARVDAWLWPALSHWAWNAFTTRTAFKTYFRRTASDGRTTILLHREVLRLGVGPPPEPGLVGDHIDGNTFDCRLQNLRWATYGLNTSNRRRT